VNAEPCACDRPAAISSFITAIRDLVKAQRSLARVVRLCDEADSYGDDIDTATVRTAMKGTR
jgi:hypothetical protein